MENELLNYFYNNKIAYKHSRANLVYDRNDQKLFIEPLNNNPETAYNQKFEHSVYIEIVGYVVVFSCKYKKCCEEITEYWKPLVVNEIKCTPDLIIDVDWEEVTRFLFRSRNPKMKDIPLEGVYFTEKSNPKERFVWNDTSPPFPPFKLDLFKGKFTGFHGAAINFKEFNHTILILGHSGTGKSTLSEILVNHFHGELLTDETICINNRTCFVNPIPRASGIVENIDNILVKREYSADTVFKSISKTAKIINSIFILNPSESKINIQQLEKIDCFEAVSPFHIDLGSNYEDCFITINQLVSVCQNYKVNYKDYQDLKIISQLVYKLISQKDEN